ncbi:GntR family transcriptional regulator [Tsukamurella asaccharolytica]|uniref:GntR family transcriptional regulator n=1 Tax=Tsukamurella asaccharolytica TaxID=2592067 RepID=A0A5C5R5D1_9ACTN|nr:GntR family transcriptional regulator [Tsukamurella asaccharolytica]TWS17932.1 GntR family transcriptional regulator [Tsukamurella asaccharolytica]
MTVVSISDAGTAATNAQVAYEHICERLMLLDIAPGDPISDERLAAELGFGRTPVREALKRLERDRLVVAYPRRGTFATGVDIADLSHISTIRKQLEPLAAGLAAANSGPEDGEELLALADDVEGIDQASSRRDILLLDVQLHRRIYRASGNPFLEDVLICQDAHATRIWCLFLDRLESLVAHVREHAALLRAIAAGDVQAAEARALEHVVGFEEDVRRVLRESAGG